MPKLHQTIRLHRDLVQLLHSCQRPGETMTALVFRLLDTSAAIVGISDGGAAMTVYKRMRHESNLRRSLAKLDNRKD